MTSGKIPEFGSKGFEKRFEEVVGDALLEELPKDDVLVVLL